MNIQDCLVFTFGLKVVVWTGLLSCTSEDLSPLDKRYYVCTNKLQNFISILLKNILIF